jgi:hypothetical protein
MKKNHILAEKIIEGLIGKWIGIFKDIEKIDIYEFEQLNIDNEPVLIYVLIQKDKKEIVGFIKLLKIVDNKNKEYFSTTGLWKKKTFNSKGFIFNFFTKWLLPKYKLIISDKGTTDLGERFWLKIANFGLVNNKDCGIFKHGNICKLGENQFIRLYNIEDFQDAWKNGGLLKRVYIKE